MINIFFNVFKLKNKIVNLLLVINLLFKILNK